MSASIPDASHSCPLTHGPGRIERRNRAARALQPPAASPVWEAPNYSSCRLPFLVILIRGRDQCFLRFSAESIDQSHAQLRHARSLPTRHNFGRLRLGETLQTRRQALSWPAHDFYSGSEARGAHSQVAHGLTQTARTLAPGLLPHRARGPHGRVHRPPGADNSQWHAWTSAPTLRCRANKGGTAAGWIHSAREQTTKGDETMHKKRGRLETQSIQVLESEMDH